MTPQTPQPNQQTATQATQQGFVPMKDPQLAGDGKMYFTHIDFPEFTVTLHDGTPYKGKPLLPNVSIDAQLADANGNPRLLTEGDMAVLAAGKVWLQRIVEQETPAVQAALQALVDANKNLQTVVAAAQGRINQATAAYTPLAAAYTFDHDVYGQVVQFEEKQVLPRYNSQMSSVPLFSLDV